MDLEPESLLLADEGGRLVGYLAGSVGGSRLPSETDRMERAIKEYRLMLRPRVLGFFVCALADTLWAKAHSVDTAGDFSDPRWPAHLHINVLPEARGTGAADGLMERWLDNLRDQNIPGCYLQTLVENARAVRFFERMGFVAHGPQLLVPGIRYNGKRLHQQTMVWNPS
jgi:ribosomal protein S18 acetylase RimI-like enzyme